MVTWLIAWTFGGGFAIYIVLWSICGREVVILRADSLAIRKEVFGVGRSHEYEIGSVRRLRVAAATYNPFDFKSGLQFWGLGGGVIAFDYGAGTVRFGSGIEEGEAHDIVEQLSSRHRFADP